ncbi:SAVED domain-containing protein [Polyangium fumosum]|uniref:SAVED domain-containing protein n=1 Tax=Polyangium fumosum TaxID=889272 RepID=A0A4U1JAK4_9BACT|nr:SAVED domain-containing protein [Polyangium fumosum]TKD05301.1 SAVED domain-containing protein [Polyangium fumosum]
MQDPNKTPPLGLLLLSQPEQLRITLEGMTNALPEAYKALPRSAIDLDDMVEAAREAIRTRDWNSAQRALEERFRGKIKPLLEKHPDYRIVYFGSAPIPMAVYLGFRLETWQNVEVIPHHHTQRLWGWVHEPGQQPARLAPVTPLDFKDRTQGQAIIRVSTSHHVDPQVTRQSVPDPVVEIDIALEQPGEDAFTCIEEMLEVAHAFRTALDIIGDQFPGVEHVHLFASVQPGMALLLGAQISTTMHPPVQTYQYARHAQNEPYHVPAILVNRPIRPAPPPLSEEELARAGRDRVGLSEDLERMKGVARKEERGSLPGWVACALSSSEGHPAFTGHWMDLPALHGTPLPRTNVDRATRGVDDTFRLSSENEWQIDDHWLLRLARRLPEEGRRQRALRLLVLHEAVHRGRQTLTRASSREIGRFPKVLEEIDYHADVWAMLYEYSLAETESGAEVENPQRFFKDLVRIATETMWAFDDDGSPMREIQIRRLNRYLIWYWQYLHLERGTGRSAVLSLDNVLAILAERPILELAGPKVVAHDDRVFFALDVARVDTPELAVYHRGCLYRHGMRYDFPITDLLQGVRERNGDRILDALRAPFEQTVR